MEDALTKGVDVAVAELGLVWPRLLSPHPGSSVTKLAVKL